VWIKYPGESDTNLAGTRDDSNLFGCVDFYWEKEEMPGLLFAVE
jgi:hypothetical protein